MVKGNRKVLGIVINIVMLGFLAWLGYTVVYGNGGIVERRRTERTLLYLKGEIAVLERNIERADLELSNLKRSEPYLTQLARELGYKRDGETVYRFMRKKGTP